MTAVQGADVDIPTSDGTADAYLAHPADGSPHPGVLLYQDAYGLRPQLRAMADRLAGAGYTVLAPNVFYRHGRTPIGEVPEFIDPAADPAIWERIGPVMASLTPEQTERDADAYLGRLADSPLVSDGPVALTGYCMGARLALRTAATHAERVAAAAGFHGGRLATDAPDSPHLGAGRITAELYFGHADQDHSMPEEQIRRLEDALCAAGVRHTCEVYPGAQHGYTQADTPAYGREADERHWAALLDLLKRAF
ncbi:carboxymethylenebutenolidase [Streptomyces griseochromogenes]|uniref:Carboxymethylenebutenolidase n=1 Tax=Streptomyces griseochromogenes TaxID=68214 RepID=A0A1B1B1P3_9ACTN|nr:dienelactone hydrolase family protein [Streptomyces griseochromogenes]ANP52672.1 dienelactone hydrolase [Streptomyces griseochromogenes]MBP2047268.1 carboxymethylenebutenolidase [Streptomyces griseochromogenes]